MIPRINAMRAIFGLMLTVMQLIFGFYIFINLIVSDFIKSLLPSGNNIFSSGGYHSPIYVPSETIEGPVKMLFIILAFMIFSYILIIFVLKLVERKEKEMKFDYFDREY